MVLGRVAVIRCCVLGRDDIIFWVNYTGLGHAPAEVSLLYPYTTAPGLPALVALALDTPLPRTTCDGAVHPLVTTLRVGAYNGGLRYRFGIKREQQFRPVIYSAHRQTMYVLGLNVKSE